MREQKPGINLAFQIFQFENKDAFYLKIYPLGDGNLQIRSNIPNNVLHEAMPTLQEYLEGKSTYEPDVFSNILATRLFQNKKAHSFFYEANFLSKKGFLSKIRVDEYESAINHFKRETPRYCVAHSMKHECCYLSFCYNKGRLFPYIEFKVTAIPRPLYEKELIEEKEIEDYCTIYFNVKKTVLVESTTFPFSFYCAIENDKVIQALIQRAYFT